MQAETLPKIPKQVFDDLMEIRNSGETNMIDRNRVQIIADREEMYELVTWIADNQEGYVKGIMLGFDVVE